MAGEKATLHHSNGLLLCCSLRPAVLLYMTAPSSGGGGCGTKMRFRATMTRTSSVLCCPNKVATVSHLSPAAVRAKPGVSAGPLR
jgi:hypothetical protein